MAGKQNISTLSGCYGCGVCAVACPRGVIEYGDDGDGFYRARVADEAGCIDCGMCLKVCAHAHAEPADMPAFEPKGYAAWSNNADTRYRCSSGGIAFELSSLLLKQGYNAVGVRYNRDLSRAEHFVADTIEAYTPAQGSKYLPSFTLPALEEMKRGGHSKYVVTGTPCQIDSIRRWVRARRREDDYVLIDIVCHGVPSRLAYAKYLDWLERRLGQRPHDIRFRDKLEGWHTATAMSAYSDEGERLHFSPLRRGDMFLVFFIHERCLNKCCYDTCKYKMNRSAADLRLGDMWGRTYAKNEEGVTGVVALTERGDRLLKQLHTCIFEEVPMSVVTEEQARRNPRRSIAYGYTMRHLHRATPIERIHRTATIMERVWGFPRRLRYYATRAAYKMGIKKQKSPRTI